MAFKEFKKVLPAVNLPLNEDQSIDEETFRKHLQWLITFDIGGLVISGHAGELESLTPEERFRVAEIARSEMPEDLIYHVTAALWSERTLSLLQQGHPQGKSIAPETALAGISIPLHPGAERFYREHGMLTEEAHSP